MKLILVRHGETKENSEGIIQGHLHGVLSKKGTIQAEELAEKLKDEKIDYIYSSDLDRASDTAKIIAEKYGEVEIILVKGLRERFLGKFQGKKKSEFGLSKEDSIAQLTNMGIESREELYERAKKFLRFLLSKHRNDTVLCVSHNGISKAIIAVIKGKRPEDINEIEKLENAEFRVYEVGG